MSNSDVGYIIGATIGFAIGGPTGAAIGGSIGGAIGGTFDPDIVNQGPRLTDLRVGSSTYGTPIPLVYGPANRLAGNLIWSSGLKEKSKKKKQGGKGGGGGTYSETYTYSADVAIALCAGAKLPGQPGKRNIRRVWCNGKLAWQGDGIVNPDDTGWTTEPGNGISKIAFYPGTYEQLVDPTIEAALGAGNAPAYRGICYIVITGLQLADYGNSIPNIEVELDSDDGRLSDILSDISERAGLDETEYSVGTLIDEDGDGISCLSDQPQAIYIAVDTSESMFDVTGNGQTRLENAQAAINEFLEYVGTVAEDVQVDVMVVGWDGSRASMLRRAVGLTEIAELQNFVLGLETIIAQTRFTEAVEDVDDFFSGAQPDSIRTVLFITDGLPYDGVNTEEYLAAAAQTILFATPSITAYGFNIDLPNTTYTAYLDNTSSDGVPVIDGANSTALLNSLQSALFVACGVRGYMVARQMEALAAIRPLEQAYTFDTVEQAGSIRYVKRGRMPIATIDLTDMRAGPPGNNSVGAPITSERISDESLPQQATLTYKDPERDYQDNTQIAQRSRGNAYTKLDTQLAMTLSNDKARQIVDRMLWEPWVARLSANFSVGDKFQWLKPADVVTVPIGGAMVPVRINRKPRGNDGVNRIEAVQEDPFPYSGYETGSVAAAPDNLVAEIPDTFAYAYNAPILYPTESATAFSWAMDANGSGWRGGEIHRSLDGSTYGVMDSTTDRNTTGTVATALGSASPDIWDRINIVTVTLLHADHELESLTDLEIYNGKNAAWLGAADGSHGELLQFATATLISSDPKVYELSDFLRGRRATEHEIGLHGNNEIFVYMEAGLMSTADYGQPDWDRARYYKGVSVYQFEVDVTTVQTFTHTGEKAMPRAPVFGRGERDSSDDLTITCIPRIRGYSPGLGYGDVVLDDQSVFECDVIVGSSVVRTIPSITPEFTYTASEQTSDGITPGDPVDIEIYQISATRGRGHPGVFTV